MTCIFLNDTIRINVLYKEKRIIEMIYMRSCEEFLLTVTDCNFTMEQIITKEKYI